MKSTHFFCFRSTGGLMTAHIGGSTDFSIPIEHQLPNDYFIRDELSYDQMVIKLAHAAIDNENQTVPTVKINLDEGFPESMYNRKDGDVEISIIGFGQTQTVEELIDDLAATNISLPDNLQITKVDYVPNDQCQTYSKDDIDYSELITSDMMCAYGNQTGQCHGDSGGPYLLLREGEDDVQVGIVSFGIGCADSEFPAVGCRTSATKWIRKTTCAFSEYPPDYFECDQFESEAPSMAPTSPTISPQPTVQQVPLTLTIRFDMFPEETGWEMWDETEQILYDSRPAGTYNASYLDSMATETIWVHHGNNYTFMITDSKDNGMSRWGILYELLAPVQDGLFYTTLVNGNGDFSHRAKHTFHVPLEDEETSSLSVPANNNTILDLAVTVYLNITFDSWPSETGWSIVHAQNHSNYVAHAPPGTYAVGSHIMETIELPQVDPDNEEETEYALIILDQFGDGMLEGGGYILWRKEEEGEEEAEDAEEDAEEDKAENGNNTIVILAQGDGDDFNTTAVHNFTISYYYL
jgi:Trypsin